MTSEWIKKSVDTMHEMDKILKKYHWPTKESLDDVDFKAIEGRIGFQLPDDYKSFLRKYAFHETQIGEAYFKLWDFDQLLEWNDAYEIIDHLNRTIGIGDNGGGELIGLQQLPDGSKRIILTPFINLEEEYHVVIGDSFTDFLWRMDTGKQWLEDNETTQ